MMETETKPPDVVVAVDPGYSTGIAIKDWRASFRDNLIVTTLETQALGEEVLWDLLLKVQPDVVVVEGFATGGHISSAGLFTVRLVGGVKALCYAMGWRFMHRAPQVRKGKLGEAESWLKERKKDYEIVYTQHEIDSLAHLLSYLFAHSNAHARARNEGQQ